MANEEHLKILKQGVEQWNKWRLENAIRPDLIGANLNGAACQPNGATLSGATLSGADLKASLDLSSASALNRPTLRTHEDSTRISADG